MNTFLISIEMKTKATGCTAGGESLVPTHISALVTMKRTRQFNILRMRLLLGLLLLCFHTSLPVPEGARNALSPQNVLNTPVNKKKASDKSRGNTTQHGNTDRGSYLSALQVENIEKLM